MNKNYILIALIFCISACTDNTVKTGEVDIISAKKMIAKDKNVVLLDVRTQEEIDLGSIQNSIHLDYFDDDFEVKLKELDVNKKYIVYCKSGNRSSKAVASLQEMGFKEAYSLIGGYEAWSKGDK